MSCQTGERGCGVVGDEVERREMEMGSGRATSSMATVLAGFGRPVHVNARWRG